jgi:hypothetical protein
MPALELDNATADGDRYRLRTVVGAELVHNVLHMDLNGFLSNIRFRSDIPIPMACRNLL